MEEIVQEVYENKDPAFLFYSSDFLTGTMFMSDAQLGKYIKLLCVQHQRGHLTEKDMLNICKRYDKDIFSKFVKDNDGNYYNIRLQKEIDKRKNYSKSRSENRKSKITFENICYSYVKHMENENINRINVIEYINKNRVLLKNRPQCLQHGDYHIGNMIITPERKLGIIDFNRYDYGDPWEEFNRIVWSAEVSPEFASGYINGYFDDDVPELFFKLLLLYICSNEISSVYWAQSFGEKEMNVMIKQVDNVMEWYDQCDSYIPKWYHK